MKTDNFKIKLVKDIFYAKEVWNILSPKELLADSWDFRYCFYKYFGFEPFFYIGFDNDEPVGMMALQYNNSRKCLEFFGGGYMVDNRIFLKPGYEKFINLFYEQISHHSRLSDIIGNDEFTRSLSCKEYKYIVKLDNFHSYEDFLKNDPDTSKSKRMAKEIARLKKDQIEIQYNNPHDLELLIEMNKKNFGKSSTFNKPFRCKIFQDLWKTMEVYLITILINGVKQAVSISIKYNGHFKTLNSGKNKKDVPNIGKYLTLQNMNLAIKLEAKIFDVGVGDCGWKEKWNFEKIPQYSLYKD